MPSANPRKSLTLRLSPDIYAALASVAQNRSLSVSALVKQNLETLIRAEEEKSRYDAYTLLGQDIEGCDVEYAIHAQSEVMYL